jgi:hypothetical protein
MLGWKNLKGDSYRLNFCWKTEEDTILESRHRLEDNIRIDLQGTCCEYVN